MYVRSLARRALIPGFLAVLLGTAAMPAQAASSSEPLRGSAHAAGVPICHAGNVCFYGARGEFYESVTPSFPGGSNLDFAATGVSNYSDRDWWGYPEANGGGQRFLLERGKDIQPKQPVLSWSGEVK